MTWIGGAASNREERHRWIAGPLVACQAVAYRAAALISSGKAALQPRIEANIRPVITGRWEDRIECAGHQIVAPVGRKIRRPVDAIRSRVWLVMPPERNPDPVL